MNKQGWLTRTADTVGGEGQDQASLAPKSHDHGRHVHVHEPAVVGTGALSLAGETR